MTVCVGWVLAGACLSGMTRSGTSRRLERTSRGCECSRRGAPVRAQEGRRGAVDRPGRGGEEETGWCVRPKSFAHSVAIPTEPVTTFEITLFSLSIPVMHAHNNIRNHLASANRQHTKCRLKHLRAKQKPTALARPRAPLPLAQVGNPLKLVPDRVAQASTRGRARRSNEATELNPPTSASIAR